MTSAPAPVPEHRPFATTLIIAILLIVIPTIGLLSVYDYIQAEARMTADLIPSRMSPRRASGNRSRT